MALILILTLSCSSSSKKSAVEKKAEIYYNQGTADLINKDYTHALKNLLQAYSLSPKDSRIANNLGMAYYFKKDSEMAVRYLKKAIELDQKNADARVNLATVRMEEGNLAAAEAEYKQILKILTYESQFRTYYNLGVISLKRKNYAQAVRYFRDSIETNKQYCPSHYELGKIAYAQRNYELALKKFKDASDGTCYDNPEPQYMQALAMLKLGHYASARMRLEDIIERFPEHKMANASKRELAILKQKGLDADASSVSKGKILSPSF